MLASLHIDPADDDFLFLAEAVRNPPVRDNLNARKIRPIRWHDMMIEWNSTALIITLTR